MDVIVIGNGVIGCAIAFELSARGARVRVVDRRQPAGGASQASGGMLVPWVEGNPSALTPSVAESSALFPEWVSRVTKVSGSPVEFRSTGSIEVAYTDGEAERLVQLAKGLQHAGVEHHLLQGDQARTAEPLLTTEVRLALVIPEHGYVDVPGLVRGLVMGADRQGAKFLAHQAVRGIVTDGERPVVLADDEDLVADAVVMATGAWAHDIRISHGPALPVRPIRGQLLYLRASQAPQRILWGGHGYLVPWGNGTVLVGATVEDVGFDERNTAAGVASLLHQATRLVPSLADARFVEARVGLRPGSADMLPIVGPSAHIPGLFFATGHGRNGVMLAPLTAKVVADQVLDGRTSALAEAAPARHGL